MTREDIIRMARDSGMELYGLGKDREKFVYYLQEFAALVSAAEREECVKGCEGGIANATDWDSSYWDQACENRAAAIRARGQA